MTSGRVSVMTKTTHIQIRCTDEQKDRWSAAAQDQGQTLTNWLADAADAACDWMSADERTKRGEEIVSHVSKRVSEKKGRGASKSGSSGCPAYHTRGVKCKLCGQTG